jgi:hypothetical protein
MENLSIADFQAENWTVDLPNWKRQCWLDIKVCDIFWYAAYLFVFTSVYFWNSSFDIL